MAEARTFVFDGARAREMIARELVDAFEEHSVEVLVALKRVLR